ncbi:hypothetical protein ACHAWO_011690 [Cyclotella atomus]|uniref:Uncharacterized protein n=1 Tax=Cyclotella atomus TaxID=382360 RepID=A0ABD3PQL8_9STRA
MTKNQWHCAADSITAGCSSTILGHPLDTIKVHQQTNKHLSKVSFTDVTTRLPRGNVLRLFRGIGAPMANQIIMNTAMFTVFDKVKDVANQSAYLDQNLGAFVAGLFSGFATACITQISLSRGTQSSRYNALSTLRHVLRDKKVDVLFITRTLYSGHVAHLAREGVFTMAYLGLYDRITNAIRNRSTVVSDGDVKNNLPLVMQQLSI